MENEFIITEDGSHTLFAPAISETYHSVHGAVQESLHVFIQTGLRMHTKKNISILEIGFGTGLNAFLSMLEAQQSQLHINYTTLELYPIPTERALFLNYPEVIAPDKKSWFEYLHNSSWGNWNMLTENFSLQKVNTDFTKYSPESEYDLVYFDAFSPEKQPEMWTFELFEKIYQHCNSGAILTTYCAKGAVRRALQQAGFTVERIPGPPGKREILRATKSQI